MGGARPLYVRSSFPQSSSMDRAGTGFSMDVVRERIRETWQVLDDADIEQSGGSLDKLVSVISLKTGQPRAEIRKELRRIFAV